MKYFCHLCKRKENRTLYLVKSHSFTFWYFDWKGQKNKSFCSMSKKIRWVLWRRDFSYRYKSLQLNLKMVRRLCCIGFWYFFRIHYLKFWFLLVAFKNSQISSNCRLLKAVITFGFRSDQINYVREKPKSNNWKILKAWQGYLNGEIT